MSEPTADPREKVLRERAQELVRAINAGECDGERILAALLQTVEEERQAADAELQEAIESWMISYEKARAEGERAGFDRAANAIRGLWPHIEVPRGDVKVGGERWHAPTVDPGAPTCLRCKIEEAINVAR